MIKSTQNLYNIKQINDVKKLSKSFFIMLILLIALLFFSIVLAVTFGSVKLTYSDAYRIIVYNMFHIPIGDIDTLTKGSMYDIIWQIRFPRVLLSAIVGMGLSTVGVAMQATVHNPLADPYILGLSSGASLGATFAILIGINGMFLGSAVGFGAFVGALLSSIFVYILSNLGGRITSVKLILSGMIISAICSAFTNFIIYTTNDLEGMKTVAFWMMGSLSAATWKNLTVPTLVVVIGSIFFVFQFRILNTMLLGDDAAITLGIDLAKYRKLYMVISSLITGVIVSVCGTIGFVGLIIPHIVRLFIGSDHKKLIPISSLFGAIFLIWTDVLARTLMKTFELPIGVITSMIGAPFLLWLMIRNSYGRRDK